MAVKVKLLQKKISGGRKTLYLDFYPAIISLKTGKETRGSSSAYISTRSRKTPPRSNTTPNS